MWCPTCEKDVKASFDPLGHMLCSVCGSPLDVVLFKRETFKLKNSTALIIPKELTEILKLDQERNPVVLFYHDGNIVIKRREEE